MSDSSYPKVYLYRRVVQAKLYIDQHFAEDIDLDNISDEAAFSKFHFIRIFKKSYGLTPHQYLKSVRIEKAILLLTRGKGITETCHAVGFESLSSFSGLFKKQTGYSPRAFVTLQQNRKIKIQEAPLSFIPGCFAKRKAE